MTEADKNRLSEMIADLRMKWETKAVFDDFYDKAKRVFRKQIRDTAARREALTRLKTKQQEILDRW